MPNDPRLVALLGALDAARRELAAALERVPPDQRDRAPALDAWSVAQLLEHLALVEERSIAAFEPVAATAPAREPHDEVADDAHRFDDAPLLDRTVRLTAPELVRPVSGATAAEAWARLARTRERSEAIVRAADGRALERTTLKHPRFGTLNGYQFVAVLAAHERRHAAQLREIGDALSAARSG